MLIPAIKKIESRTKKPFLGVIPKIDHNIPAEDSLDGQKNKDSIHIKNLESINREIDIVSKTIENAIDIEYILKKIIK